MSSSFPRPTHNLHSWPGGNPARSSPRSASCSRQRCPADASEGNNGAWLRSACPIRSPFERSLSPAGANPVSSLVSRPTKESGPPTALFRSLKEIMVHGCGLHVPSEAHLSVPSRLLGRIQFPVLSQDRRRKAHPIRIGSFHGVRGGLPLSRLF